MKSLFRSLRVVCVVLLPVHCAEDPIQSRTSAATAKDTGSQVSADAEKPSSSSQSTVTPAQSPESLQARDDQEAASPPQNISGVLLSCQPVEASEDVLSQTVSCDFRNDQGQSVYSELPASWYFSKDSELGRGIALSYDNQPDDPFPHKILVSSDTFEKTHKFIEDGGIQWIQIQGEEKSSTPVQVQVIYNIYNDYSTHSIEMNQKNVIRDSNVVGSQMVNEVNGTSANTNVSVSTVGSQGVTNQVSGSSVATGEEP